MDPDPDPDLDPGDCESIAEAGGTHVRVPRFLVSGSRMTIAPNEALVACERDDPRGHALHLAAAAAWGVCQSIANTPEGIAWGVLLAVTVIRLPKIHAAYGPALRSPAWILLLLWMVWMLVSVTWTHPRVDQVGALRPIRWLATPLLLWPVMRYPWFLLGAIALGGFVQAIVVVVSSIRADQMPTYSDLSGLTGFGDLQIVMGTLFAILIGAASAVTVRTMLWRPALLVVSALAMYVVIQSGGRTSLLAGVASLLVLIIRPHRARLALRFLGAAIAVTAVVVLANLSGVGVKGWDRLVAEFRQVSPPAAVDGWTPTLIAPNNLVSDPVPTFRWTPVEDASWYQLWVNDSTGTVIKRWYTAAQVNADSGECSVTPGETLASGRSQWWVRAWSESRGNGKWSSGRWFSTAGLFSTLVGLGSHRGGLWIAAVEFGTQRILFGHGRHSFPPLIQEWAAKTATTNPEMSDRLTRLARVNHAHNSFLNIWVEGGLIGVLLFSGGLAMLCSRSWRASADDPVAAVAAALLAIVLLNSMFGMAEFKSGGALIAVALAISMRPTLREQA